MEDCPDGDSGACALDTASERSRLHSRHTVLIRVRYAAQNPVYKVLLPNPDLPGDDQPLFQVSKPNPNAPWWSLFYFA